MSYKHVAPRRVATGVTLALGAGFALGWIGSPGHSSGFGSETQTLSSPNRGEHIEPTRSTSEPAVSAPLQQGPKTLEVRRIIGDENGPFGRLWDLTLVGDDVVVLDWEPLEGRGQILVLDRQSGKIFDSGGPRGQGPGDLRQPQSIQSVPGTHRFWINDYRNGRMVLYDLDEPLSRPLDHVRIRSSPYQAYWSDGFLYMNGLYVTELVRRYVREGPSTRIDEEIGAPLLPDATPEKLQHLNRNKLVLHPSRDRLAVAFTFLDRIQIYDHAGTLLHDLEGPAPDQTDPSALLPIDGSWEPQVRDVRATDETILVLAYRRDEQLHSHADRIWVYSWDGKLLQVLYLEEPLSRFALDYETGRLWGIQEDGTALVEFASPVVASADR